MLESSSHGEAGLAVLFSYLPRGGSCWSLGLHFWVDSSTGEVSKILPLSYFTQPHGMCGSQLFPPTDVCSSPETNGISNKKCSPTLAAKVGSEILCLDGLKPSFVLFVGLQASLSLFVGSREDSGHRRGVLSQQRFPAPVFCVGHEGRITPSPSACLLSPAAELHTL